jgi:hypothetical protein
MGQNASDIGRGSLYGRIAANFGDGLLQQFEMLQLFIADCREARICGQHLQTIRLGWHSHH